MAKRSGLGQRGLDLLISGSPGASSRETSEEKNTPKKKTAAKSSTSAKSKTSSSAKSSKTKASSKKSGTTAKKSGTSTKKTAASKINSEAANIKNNSANQEKLLNEEIVLTANQEELQSEEIAFTKAEEAMPELLDSAAENGNNEPLMVPISQVEPNRSQPRKNFNEDALEELADSIRQFGVIQPLIVQKKDDYYEIIAGERRWRAARLASLKEVPVLVKDYTPKEVMEISLIENIQREDLNPIEEAAAFRRLMEEFDLKQDEVAQRVSKSRASIANSVRLLNLDKRVQEMVIGEMLSTGHARALLAITDQEVQYATAQKAFDEKLTVRDVEKLVKKMMNQTPASPVKKQISDALAAVYLDLSEKMKASLGTKVSIAPRTAQKGKIEIEYYSQDELDRLCSLLNGIGQGEEV